MTTDHSTFVGAAHVPTGYNGQQFEVRAYRADGSGVVVIGWCNNPDGSGLMRGAKLWPWVRDPWIVELDEAERETLLGWVRLGQVEQTKALTERPAAVPPTWDYEPLFLPMGDGKLRVSTFCQECETSWRGPGFVDHGRHFHCTRAPKHDGDHAAHVSPRLMVCRWPATRSS